MMCSMSETTYLGFYVVSHTEFCTSIYDDLRGFFGSANAILTSVKRPKENVLMQLLYSNCVPKLAYGAAVKDLSATEMRQYNVAVNNAVRRIFGFRYWQSIRHIREVYEYQSIEQMFANVKKKFYRKMTGHSNSIIRFLSSLEPTVVE